MLSDLLVLDLNQPVPTWRQVQPRLLAGKVNTNSTSRPALLALAGHCGGVDASGQCIFWGGYRRNDLKEPQAIIQVLQQGVKPPTADAAQLTGEAASPLVMALQHVRQHLARLVRQHHPQQVSRAMLLTSHSVLIRTHAVLIGMETLERHGSGMSSITRQSVVAVLANVSAQRSGSYSEHLADISLLVAYGRTTVLVLCESA